MSIDARAFRDTVGQFVTGVTVIATEADGSVRAMTANAFTSLSLDPPLVLFCVGKTAHLSALIRSASGFSVNILAQTQRDLSTYFAGGWRQPVPPAFSFTSWQGGPLLNGCTAALGCAVDTIHEGGDHWIVIGRVLALYRNEEACPPLVFRGGRYAALEQPAEVPGGG
jgi:3-hydroxy-9,10-secoandrosta-1,3,5(10)-triene-9,17-dione monooxygenase reductase component